jgi:hypothetical protein
VGAAVGATRQTSRALRSVIALAALLLILAVPAILTPRIAGAEDYAVAESYSHAFSNNVTVYTELFALNKDLSLDTSVYGKYTVDFIQPGLFNGEDDGDAVSGASSSAGGTDIRNELTAGITHNFSDLFGAALYYDFSTEKDFKSSTPSLSLTKELFKKNTTLSLGWSRNYDDISGRFLDNAEARTTDNYYFGLTQVVSPVTILQAGYSLIKSDGHQSEGIRLVPVDGASASSCEAKSATCLVESMPGSKTRWAYIFGINHYFEGLGSGGPRGFFDDSSVKLTLRYYDDDWDIESYTAEIEHYRRLSNEDILKLNYRFYTQTSAFFFKDSYLSTDSFKTASPQHKSFNTHLAGVRLTHKFERPKPVGPFELGHVEGKYEFYLESSGVHAHIFMLSFRLQH